ncbi:hypothetical protein Tco_0032291 [Tanacetum coccineum]
MAAIKFASSHNMVAFLDKSTESDGFEQIVDFLNAHPIKYALTVNPTIYTACIEQFWTTAKVQTVNGDMQIQALLDKKKVIITETSIRRDLQLADENGTECLPNATIFAELEIMSGPTEPMADETENVESVPTHSNDSLLSSEDRLKLNELMELCTTLSQRVLDLENTKTSQAAEITKLKERVKKLERRNKSRTPGLKRLRKVGRTTRIESSEDEGLGDQEDASKQERKIVDIDADEEEIEVEKVVSTAEVTTASATTTTVDKLTLDQTLIEIKAAKPKAVTTAATTTTTAVTRPKARGVAKDKGKAKMVEPEKPLKKKDQILMDEEIAQRLQEELQVELEEEERLARQKEEDANIVEWDNVQAMIDADYELAARLQAQEQVELTIEERSKMFVELMDKRKKHFARLRAEDQRRKPPTKAQKRNMDTELVKESSKKAEMAQESSSKRAGNKLEQEKANKQKIHDDEAEIKKHMEIIPDDEVAIDVIPLATKPPIISIDREDFKTLWKLVKAKHENTRLEEGYKRVLWGCMNDLEDDVRDGRDELADSEKMIGHCGGGDPLVFRRDGEEMDFLQQKGVQTNVYVGDYDDDAASGRVQVIVLCLIPIGTSGITFMCSLRAIGGSIPFEEALAARVSSNLH